MTDPKPDTFPPCDHPEARERCDCYDAPPQRTMELMMTQIANITEAVRKANYASAGRWTDALRASLLATTQDELRYSITGKPPLPVRTEPGKDPAEFKRQFQNDPHLDVGNAGSDTKQLNLPTTPPSTHRMRKVTGCADDGVSTVEFMVVEDPKTLARYGSAGPLLSDLTQVRTDGIPKIMVHEITESITCNDLTRWATLVVQKGELLKEPVEKSQ